MKPIILHISSDYPDSLRPRLAALAEWIIEDMKAKGVRPALVEAHKFTVEGLIGQRVAQAFSCPLICDIQGNTDVMILKNKPGFRRRYRAIAQEAALVFPFAPWVLEPFERLAGLAPEKAMLLPVMPAIDTLSPAPALASGKILSVFNLDSWGLKKLSQMPFHLGSGLIS